MSSKRRSRWLSKIPKPSCCGAAILSRICRSSSWFPITMRLAIGSRLKKRLRRVRCALSALIRCVASRKTILAVSSWRCDRKRMSRYCWRWRIPCTKKNCMTWRSLTIIPWALNSSCRICLGKATSSRKTPNGRRKSAV